MSRIHFLFLLLVVTSAVTLFGQQPSDDFFPLSVGNRWVYNYSTTYEEQVGGWTDTDSGSAVYTIVSSSSATDSTIWVFKEVRTIIHHHQPYMGFDTSYAVNDSALFQLIEYTSGNHIVVSSAWFWQSVYYLNPKFTDSTQFYRYFPSVTQDTFTVIHREYSQTYLLEVFSVSYQRALGLTRVSYRDYYTGAVHRSNHSLLSAVLTSLEDKDRIAIPETFVLGNSYPNPFNPMTTIPFQTSKDERVTIRIYDILGRMIVTLMDDDMPAGFHSLIWNASMQSSGTYVCVARANAISKSTRLLLVK